MATSFRSLSHSDFRRRVKRVDPVFYRWGERGALKDATASRPFGAILTGFAWAYVVISVATNRAVIEDSLRKGNLPEQYHDHIFMGLAALLATSAVMLALHLFRYFFRSGGKKSNSGGMLVGVLGALMLVYTPANVWNTGFNMLDDNSRSILMTASASVGDALPGVDFGAVTFVSSQGK